MSEKKKSTIIHEGQDTPASPKHRHYIDNAKFYQALKDRRAHIDNGEKVPKRLEDYIGECLMLIAQKLGSRWNFANYSFRDEMVEDGIVANIRALDKFDVTQYSNPLSYFTQCTYFAFLGRIEQEENTTATKYRAMIEAAATGGLDVAEDEHADHILDNLDVSMEYMVSFLEKYDTKQEKKRASRRKKPKNETTDNGVSQLWEHNDQEGDGNDNR